MPFHPIETNSFDIGYTLLSAFVVVFGLLSLFSKEKLYIGEAVWATVFGIIIGPYCAGVFNPREWGAKSDYNSDAITIQVTRIVLAVGVFAIGVELPNAYVGRHWKSLAFLLIPVMVFGWFVSSALIYAFIPGLDYLNSLAIAACLTPTDPILAAAVVGGRYAEKHVPAHLRHLLAAESGVNDGAAFPMLFISLYLILDKSDATAVGHWFYITWVYEIILGTVLGTILGYSARHIMKFCERHDLIDRHSYVAQYISLALLSNGITTILGSDDLLASFACGTAFAYDGWFNTKTEETSFSNVIDLLFNCACFIYVGAWIPFGEFNNHELGLSWWRLLVIALLIILLRRLPIMLALYKWIPEVKTLREAIFSGHFGPMGVGAVFIATLAIESIPKFYPQVEHRPPETQLELLAACMQPIVAFIVLVSIAIHGLSIPFFSLGKRVHSISRTWSRHTSLEPTGLPEWANQARRVNTGEEIVINRDPENIDDVLQKLERGEIPRTESAGELTPTSPTSYDEEKKRIEYRAASAAADAGIERGGLRVGEADVTERRDSLKRQPGSEGRILSSTAKKEATGGDHSPNSDRGGETQWREGNDLIIERKRAPGEEVEVELIKNCFHPDERSISKIITGAKEQVRARFGYDAKLAKAGMHELAKCTSPPPEPANAEPVPETSTLASAPKPKEDDFPADISKDDKDPEGIPSRDDSQQSSDTEGADVEDNPGGGGSGGSPAAYNSPSELSSPSVSRSPSRPRSPGLMMRATDAAAAAQGPAGLPPRRRESFRRKLFSRSPFTRSGHGRKSSRSPVGRSTQSDDAGESENDDDEPQPDSPVQSGPPRPHNAHTHHRSRSESPRRIAASAGSGGRRHRKHRSEHRFELPAPESRDEVEDARALSSAPSPNVLHQRLDTLAAVATAAASERPSSANASGSGESRQNSLGSPTTSTPPGGRSRIQSGTASGTLANRSIRFAEELGFERNDSSGSLSRMSAGAQHHHLHYQHSHGARRSSPNPNGATTPRGRIAPIGTPIGAVIGGGTKDNNSPIHGHSQKPPLSELF